MAMEDVACIVYGQKSSRSDWRDKKNPSCDHHSAEEVQSAIAKLAPKTKSEAGTTGKTPPPAPPAASVPASATAAQPPTVVPAAPTKTS